MISIQVACIAYFEIYETYHLKSVLFIWKNCVPCITHGENKSVTNYALIVLTFINVLHTATGGICWFQKSKEDLCRNYLSLNMSKEECCSISDIPSVSWSPHDRPSSGKLFYWEALVGGAPECYRCHNSCDSITCPKDKVCRMRKERPKCVCKPRCPTVVKMKGSLCGTDGRNYKNYCRLLKHNCKRNRETEIAYFGKCKIRGLIRNVAIHLFKFVVCTETSIEYIRYYMHVLLYKAYVTIWVNSKCQSILVFYIAFSTRAVSFILNLVFKVKDCLYDPNSNLNHSFLLTEILKTSCKMVKCMNGKRCLEDQDGLPRCAKCVTTCKSNAKAEPVCGSNNVTYDSVCHLRVAVCLQGLRIRAAYNGRCCGGATCDNVVCPMGFTCLKQLNTNTPQCVDCRETECKKSKKKVCGTDGHTYKNNCELRRISCKKKIAVYTKSHGSCKKRNHTCKRCRRKRKRRFRKKQLLRSFLRQNVMRKLKENKSNSVPIKPVKLVQIVRKSGKEIIGTDADFG
ncbi:hypothetical protein KUTeg_017730 [Tegillarca granosa]|uniref:Kazal-like domain-containing protein n=1 Tax=Tegillarca granosa TaxID=220873 RepID=A0ABQ9EFS1_TEGGR|nr:hypothetical protein KUTeg_017730 [Tegillarca granosa]